MGTGDDTAFGSKGALDVSLGYLDVSLGYYVKETRIAYIEINNWVKADGLERLTKLDKIMRSQNVRFKKATRQPPGKETRSADLANCFHELSERNSNETYQTLRKILHADELLSD